MDFHTLPLHFELPAFQLEHNQAQGVGLCLCPDICPVVRP